MTNHVAQKNVVQLRSIVQVGRQMAAKTHPGTVVQVVRLGKVLVVREVVVQPKSVLHVQEEQAQVVQKRRVRVVPRTQVQVVLKVLVQVVLKGLVRLVLKVEVDLIPEPVL